MKKELLEALCSLPGASGFEQPVRDYLIKAWKSHLSVLDVDKMGNLIGILPSKKTPTPKLNVLIMAHMDEVGLIVRDITEDGYIHFDALGGQTVEVLAGQLWHIHTADRIIEGYTGLESGHTITSFPQTNRINQKILFIDIGAKTREEVEELGIRPGLSITYGGKSYSQNKSRVLAKALDDRFGLAVMTELLEKIAQEDIELPFNLMFAATVQEELGMRGAKVIYKSLKPDLVINLDIGLARDYPLLFSQSSDTPATSKSPKLGQGISMTVYDSSMIANPKLVDFLIKMCRENTIPFQLDSSSTSAVDACCLQQSGRGLPVVNIGIPVRYAHSALSMMDSVDYDSLLKLLTHFSKTYTLETHQKLFDIMPLLKMGLFPSERKEDVSHALTLASSHESKEQKMM